MSRSAEWPWLNREMCRPTMSSSISGGKSYSEERTVIA